MSAWWVRGLHPAELPCREKPEWAEFAETVLAGMPAQPSAPGGDLPGTSGFAAVLAPFADLAGTRLTSAVGCLPVELASVVGEFKGRLAATLGWLAARTLVLELHVARVGGHLSGDTGSERFRSFLGTVSTRTGMAALLSEYPVLARILAQSCVHSAAALAELLGRFGADRAELVANLLHGVDPGLLVAVDRTAGDGHRRGRSVAVLRFADGTRVVYKPQPIGAHRHFNELVGWFNARPGTPGLRTLALLDRSDYGWVEYVSPEPCTTGTQLERFYHRQGALLALVHLLDATDLHFENLIACADQPVLVDVETLFHPPGPVAAGEDPEEDPAALALTASVLRTGLLPHLLVGDETALDASGLGGDPGGRSPVETVDWAAAGTDEMRLVRRAGALGGAANRPRLDGVDADPETYTEALLAGLRAGRRAILEGQDELLGEHGLLQRFADDVVRVVARDTQLYATVLSESTHPDVLRDAAERDAVLRLLGTDALGDPGWPLVLEDEIAELWEGDIPLFTARPAAVDLWSGTGRRLPCALERPGLDRVADRLRAMDRDVTESNSAGSPGSQDGLGSQEWIVRAAMASRSTAPAHGTGTPIAESATQRAAGPGARIVAPRDRLLAAARGIADQLLGRAHHGPARTNWLALELLGDRYWRVGAAGADLAGGYPGPAVFLADLAMLTGESRYAEAALRVLRPVPHLLDRLAARPEQLGVVGSGGFAGLGGIVYALARVATGLDDAEIRDWIAPATALTVAAAEAEDTQGVRDGTAGGLAALLAVHRITGTAESRRAAEVCAARLLGGPLPPTSGFAAGAAGVGWALLGFAAAGGGARYERAGTAALRSAVAGTAAARAEGGSGLSWCEGLPGVALALADSPAARADPAWAAAVEDAVRLVASVGPLPGHSLCHGELGVLELLGAAPGHEAGRVLARRTGALLESLDRHGPRCGTPAALPTPGLLTGLAGIGHGLLRLGFADLTASALLLRPPTSERPSYPTAQPSGKVDLSS
ncbi:type 2 lanthipeptide synthetase LanM family protein [Streptomyces sp. NPDC058657]|uniref:type 2 lanthipeptide synthetase LanM family protein n=1 Tax=unclassified Streptomyces TaxID=2593676 RepID=UPI00366A3255